MIPKRQRKFENATLVIRKTKYQEESKSELIQTVKNSKKLVLMFVI
jgi:hypothetical protein